MLEYAAARRKGNVEMKRIILVAACLACGVTSFVGVASASAALPAFFECDSVGTGKGKFAKGCKTEKPGGGFEVVEGVGNGKPFQSKGGSVTYNIPATKGEYTCTQIKTHGTVTGPKLEQKITMELRGCSTLGKKCKSEGKIAGTIETFALKATIGYINKGNLEVGVDLNSETGTEIARFECEGLSFIWTGSLIGELTPVNTFTKHTQTRYEITGEGFQAVQKLEGGEKDVLESTVNGSGPFDSGIHGSFESVGEELNVKA
jgi:hypothetical protein